MQGVTHTCVSSGHELGDRVDAPPGADPLVFGEDVIGEAGAKECPLAPVNAGGVSDEHFGDVLARLTVGCSCHDV